MSAHQTQANKILTLLRQNGRGGLTTIDFVSLNPPILRGAARIHELKKLGYSIRSEKVEGGIFRYWLEKKEPEQVTIFDSAWGRT